ncbi:hypothetical protein HOLleu_42247 [Holothuria leucospilota]|uniref:Uncharacterized protein n=1 Tax=Holothuria leucospilota TaxID=206669 RepID=A0A9Q0YAS0_HOLLE|nr:hypothetical protein HOLleu_42247 [Holothuria leucospilota]
MIESWWAFLRKHWTQFWIEHFAKLSQDGYFDGRELAFEFINAYFLHPQLQNELARIAEEWNDHHVRSSRNANCPFGRPLVMYNAPDLYGTRDFGHPVSQNEALFCKEGETDQNVYPSTLMTRHFLNYVA